MAIETKAIGNNVKVDKFLKYLATKVNHTWKGQRVTDMGEVHRHIDVVTRQALNEFGIEGLEPTTHSIKIFDIWEDIFHYNIDYKEDKRYKYDMVGTINKVEFATTLAGILINKETTVDDLIRAVQRRLIAKATGNVKSQLEESRQEIIKLEADLEELKKLSRKFE